MTSMAASAFLWDRLLLQLHGGIGRDEKVFGENVEKFVPERWLKPQSGGQETDDERSRTSARVRRDLPTPFFGYGRRMCTGRLLAEDGLWIAIARLLWAFEFEEADKPSKLDPDDMKPHGFTITPGPFRIHLKPRGPWARSVIQQEWENADKDVSVVLGEMPQVDL